MSVVDHEAKMIETGKCMVCGERSTSFWAAEATEADGGHNIEVCRSCAFRVLPALIADALQLPSAGPMRAQRSIQGLAEADWERAGNRYWKCVAALLARTMRKEATEVKSGELAEE